jgi:hypothetical protein
LCGFDFVVFDFAFFVLIRPLGAADRRWQERRAAVVWF